MNRVLCAKIMPIYPSLGLYHTAKKRNTESNFSGKAALVHYWLTMDKTYYLLNSLFFLSLFVVVAKGKNIIKTEVRNIFLQ